MTVPANEIGFMPDKARAEAARRHSVLALAGVSLFIAAAILVALSSALAS